MRLLHGHDASVVGWLEHKMQDKLMPPWRGIGVIDDAGHLRAAHVLQPVTMWCSEWTLYSEQALTHGVMRAFFRHVFDDLKIHRLQIRTKRTNRAIRRAAPKFGFKFEGAARGYWGPDGDAFVFAMSKDQCRWMKDHTHGQRQVGRDAPAIERRGAIERDGTALARG